MSLGDLATWVGSVGTAGALIVSLWLLGREQSDRRHRESEARASQAALVAAWIAGVDPLAKPHPEIRIRIRNANMTPIYDVSFQFAAGVRGTWVRSFWGMGPQETREFLILIPGYIRAEPKAPRLTFTDSVGRQWLREPDGDLQELAPGSWIHFEEDPAQAGTIDQHPTLHLPKDEWMKGGRIIE